MWLWRGYVAEQKLALGYDRMTRRARVYFWLWMGRVWVQLKWQRLKFRVRRW